MHEKISLEQLDDARYGGMKCSDVLQILSTLPADYDFIIDSRVEYGFYDDVSCRIELYAVGHRPETDDEYNARTSAEAKKSKKQPLTTEQKELKQLKRLMKKYKGKY